MSGDVEQALCLTLERGAGAKYINYYDYFSPPVREILRSSRVNICVACFYGHAGPYPTPDDAREVVSSFEAQACEGQQ